MTYKWLGYDAAYLVHQVNCWSHMKSSIVRCNSKLRCGSSMLNLSCHACGSSYALSVVCLPLHFCKANEDFFFQVKKLMEIACMQLIDKWSVTSPCGTSCERRPTCCTDLSARDFLTYMLSLHQAVHQHQGHSDPDLCAKITRLHSYL